MDEQNGVDVSADVIEEASDEGWRDDRRHNNNLIQHKRQETETQPTHGETRCETLLRVFVIIRGLSME